MVVVMVTTITDQKATTGLLKFILILSCPISGIRRKLCLGDFVKKKQKQQQKPKNLKYWLAFMISFKFGVMIDTTKLNALILVSIAMTFIQDHSFTRKQKLLCWCSCKFVYQFG